MIVPTLQRGNAAVAAPAALITRRRSVACCIPTLERGNDPTPYDIRAR
jgi:hypothetical protein